MNKTTYIVSGYMRSGTSMMMEALIAGGMDASYSKKRAERMNDKWGAADKVNGYRPNKEYYELEAEDYAELDFPEGFEGKLIKCLWKGAARINNGEYRCIFMRRPRLEIERSLVAFFGNATETVRNESFDKLMGMTVDKIRDRHSYISVDEIWYGDVVDDPLSVFKNLADNGWPIDPYKAAAVPQDKMVRQTKRDLEPRINFDFAQVDRIDAR